MECPEYDTIEYYVVGGLDPRILSDFEAHIEVCSSCKMKLLEARENEELLAELRSFDETVRQSPPGNPAMAMATVKQAQSLLGRRYRVIRKIGQGGAGVVFEAVDTVLERVVAVKFLGRKSRPSYDDSERWREARLMSQLNHQNIAQIYEIGELDDHQFIVMEWVNGLPITDAWRDLKLEQRLGIYLGLLEAVSAAHRRGIVHRDLKPSNILVTARLKAKALDFGIAIETAGGDGVETRLYKGTPAYSAPEQIDTPKNIGPATDVFALGILLYQLLTDTLPFPQTRSEELFKAIRNEYPELPTAVAEKIPIPLQNICLKALEKKPDKRYLNAQALCDDINRYLRGERVWSKPSFLADKIQQEVFYHRQKLKVWRDNEILTEREHDRLERIYERLIAPPDPSIIEARELSLSQVCLYFGGWISVLGSFLLFYRSWENIPAPLRPMPAILATALMVILGIWMWRKNEGRLAVGFLVTSNLLIPITTLLMLGQWHILGPTTHPWGSEAIAEGLNELEAHLVVGNLQLFVSAACWLSFSLLFLKITRSSIFVLLATVAFLLFLTVCYIIGGMLDIDEPWGNDVIAGRYLYPGIGIFLIGVIVDRRRLTHYAIPLCVVGLALIVGALSGIAISENNLFGWLSIRPQFLEANEQIGLSFLVNGLVYLSLGTVCRLTRTALQRRLAQILNFLGPLHVLGVLRILDLDQLFLDNRIIYRIALPLASMAFVFGSVARQMKAFFFSGLAGIAAAVHKFTIEHLDKFFAWPVSLIFAGVIWMLVSWLVPRWQANWKLRIRRPREPKAMPKPPNWADEQRIVPPD